MNIVRLKVKAKSKDTIAYWKDRAYMNDYLWAECSNCGFTIENYKACTLGRSSTDYIEVKYNYCPRCGKGMRVFK